MKATGSGRRQRRGAVSLADEGQQEGEGPWVVSHGDGAAGLGEDSSDLLEEVLARVHVAAELVRRVLAVLADQDHPCTHLGEVGSKLGRVGWGGYRPR